MMQEIIKMLEAGAASAMSIEQIIKTEIDDWMRSDTRKWMLTGQRYYVNDTDVLQRKRMVVGEGGLQVEDKNLANNKLVNGFVRKLVDQKVGYLLSKPFSIQTANELYAKALGDLLGKDFLRMLKNVGKDSVNKGKGWIHIYYNEKGVLSFKRMKPEEIIPLWRDTAHTELDALIRKYEVETYEGTQKKIITKVEFWDQTGVRRYLMGTGDANQGASGIIPDIEAGEQSAHFSVINGDSEEGYNWERIPFICFKYNDEELPLVQMIKSLVDDYDYKKSDNANNLEDLPNSIYVVKDYDGTDLGEFRHNLSVYRTAKVTESGGLSTIGLEIDTEAFKTHIEMNRKDIYEFGRGIDTQSDKFGNSPSGIALRFLYSDLDMDANDIETEFQASLEQLLWFVNQHLANTGTGEFSNETVDFIFNRDILINETEAVDNAEKSKGVISDETIISNHPWVTDPKEEMNRLSKQREEETKRMVNADYPNFNDQPGNDPTAGE